MAEYNEEREIGEVSKEDTEMYETKRSNNYNNLKGNKIIEKETNQNIQLTSSFLNITINTEAVDEIINQIEDRISEKVKTLLDKRIKELNANKLSSEDIEKIIDSKLNNIIENLEKKIEEKISLKFNEINEKIDKISKKLDSIEKNIEESCEKKKKKIENQLGETTKKISDLEKKVDDVFENLLKKIGDMINKNIKKILEDISSDINSLKTQIGAIEELKNKLNQKEREVEDKEELIEKQNKKIEELEKKFDITKSEREILEFKLKEKEKFIKEQNTKIEKLEENFVITKSEKEILESKLKEKEKMINKLQKDMENYNKKISELENKLTNLDSLESFKNVFEEPKFRRLFEAVLKNPALEEFRKEYEILDNSPKSMFNFTKFLKNERVFVLSIYDYIVNYKKNHQEEMDEREIEFYNAINDYFDKEVFYKIEKKVNEDKFDKSYHRGINNELRGELSDDKLVLIPPCKIDDIKMKVKLK